MSLHTTRPPRLASSTANAAPMPLPAPVMTAAASWLRFFDDPKSPMTFTPLPRRWCWRAAHCAMKRRDPAHGGRRLGRQSRQRLEDMHLVGPDLQFALAAGGADSSASAMASAASISAPPAWMSVGGSGRPPATSSVSRGWVDSIPAQYNSISRAASSDADRRVAA